MSNFKTDLLVELKDLNPDILTRVSCAFDKVSYAYNITATGSELAVVGREEFMAAATAYCISKRTEGQSNITIKNVGYALNKFITAMNKPMDKVRTVDIRGYLFNYQDTTGISNRSLDHLRSTLCAFWRWLNAEGYIDSNPAANIKPIKFVAKPRKALTQIELERIRRACQTDRERAIVETLYSTGCRVSELCSIKISDVDFDRKEILILGKGGKYRQVYLNAKALVALQIYLQSRKQQSEMLIAPERNGRDLHKAGIECIFKRIAKETGIAVTPHIMRHTFATQALTGTTVEVVQKMLGHSSIATTMIYAEVDERNVRTSHERVII